MANEELLPKFQVCGGGGGKGWWGCSEAGGGVQRDLEQ